mgnify:CR=1 FL=1
MKSMHYVFNETSARREDFTKITGSEVFPKPFCATRWLEDLSVAERAIQVWPNVCTYVNWVVGGPQSNDFVVREKRLNNQEKSGKSQGISSASIAGNPAM